MSYHTPKEQVVCVLGNYRCGTTWLAEVITRGLGPDAALLFEPIRAYYPPMREAGVTAWRPVLYDGLRNAPALKLFASVFDGTFVDGAASGGREVARTDVEAVRRSSRLVVKMVRGLCALPWFMAAFPHVHCVVIARHPFAAISSQLQVGAAKGTPKDSAELEPFFRAYPEVPPFLPQSDEEWLATYWAMGYHCAFEVRSKVMIRQYEELASFDSAQLRASLSRNGLELAHDLRPELRSMTDMPNLRPGGKAPPARVPWKEHLSFEQKQRIWHTVNNRFFGLAEDLGYQQDGSCE